MISNRNYEHLMIIHAEIEAVLQATDAFISAVRVRDCSETDCAEFFMIDLMISFRFEEDRWDVIAQ